MMYETPTMEVILFDAEAICTLSSGTGEETINFGDQF